MAPGGWVPLRCSLSLEPRPRHPLGLWHWVPSCGEQMGAGSEEGPGWDGQGDSELGQVTEEACTVGPAVGCSQPRTGPRPGNAHPQEASSAVAAAAVCGECPPGACGGAWGQPASPRGGEHALAVFLWKEDSAGEEGCRPRLCPQVPAGPPCGIWAPQHGACPASLPSRFQGAISAPSITYRLIVLFLYASLDWTVTISRAGPLHCLPLFPESEQGLAPSRHEGL